MYTTPQEKEGIAKEIQQRPPQPYARVKNETFVNPPDKIPQPIPSAPSETSKLYDLLNIAFMKQVEENAKITKTINNITPEIQRTLNANIQPVGIGGRPPVIPYGHTEESWAAIDHKNRGKERIKSVNREKIDLFREANPDSTIQDDTILRNIRKKEKAEARTPADKRATVAEEERIYREKQNKEDQKDEDYIPSSKKEKRKKSKTGKKR